ncbi:structural protein [Pseudomonas phage vB_PaeM_USP_25]|nr:structural protein [Pseudomonas phage vB_PaeM_USP_25]
MTLADLIAAYRTDANDKAVPYFASDEEVTGWLNEAENEAAIRGRLIHESDTPAVCEIAVVAGTASYPLHASLYELSHVAFRPDGGATRKPVLLVSSEYLDACMRDWRDREGCPQYAIQSDSGIRLVPRPDAAGTLILEGYRLPMEPMLLAEQETATPEINGAHHRHLVQWALHCGFSIPDTESFDPNRAGIAEAAFTQYFGHRPDSDLRRITREDVPQTVKAFWP